MRQKIDGVYFSYFIQRVLNKPCPAVFIHQPLVESRNYMNVTPASLARLSSVLHNSQWLIDYVNDRGVMFSR